MRRMLTLPMVAALVVMPFAFSDGTCLFCHDGLQTECVHGGFFGNGGGIGGAQAEAIRVPQADGTLYVLPADAAFPRPPDSGMTLGVLNPCSTSHLWVCHCTVPPAVAGRCVMKNTSQLCSPVKS